MQHKNENLQKHLLTLKYIKDTIREKKAPSNEIPELTKSTNMGI